MDIWQAGHRHRIQVLVRLLQMGAVSNPSCDLMRAGLAEGEMVLLVCGGGPAGEAATRQHIEVSARQRWELQFMSSCLRCITTACGAVLEPAIPKVDCCRISPCITAGCGSPDEGRPSAAAAALAPGCGRQRHRSPLLRQLPGVHCHVRCSGDGCGTVNSTHGVRDTGLSDELDKPSNRKQRS